LGERGGEKKKKRKRKRRRAALFKECRPSHFREKEKRVSVGSECQTKIVGR
jgi:hypothetical protein